MSDIDKTPTSEFIIPKRLEDVIDDIHDEVQVVRKALVGDIANDKPGVMERVRHIEDEQRKRKLWEKATLTGVIGLWIKHFFFGG